MNVGFSMLTASDTPSDDFCHFPQIWQLPHQASAGEPVEPAVRQPADGAGLQHQSASVRRLQSGLSGGHRRPVPVSDH